MGNAERQWADEILRTMSEAIAYESKLARGTRGNLVVNMSPATFRLLQATVFQYMQFCPISGSDSSLCGVPIEIDKRVADGCVHLTEKVVRAFYKPTVDTLIAADIEEGELHDLLR